MGCNSSSSGKRHLTTMCSRSSSSGTMIFEVVATMRMVEGSISDIVDRYIG